MTATEPTPKPTPVSPAGPEIPTPTPIVLSFDVEEHDRIEAATRLVVPNETKMVYAARMVTTTERILAQLGAVGVKATFYIVGDIARSNPQLVRAIASGGHEIGSHGWDHRRVHTFTPKEFGEDIRRSKETLEHVSGTPVVGYRAPTFSVMRGTAWAVDVLAESGLAYDSSVFPVRHDRYGVPDAPRHPFIAEGRTGSILELPPATWRVGGQNLPVAGGGYFRLFPPAAMDAGIAQLTRANSPLTMLYFHPWEFDPDQPRLPLGRFARWRTYVGVGKSSARLDRLLGRYRERFCRAIDVATTLNSKRDELSRFRFTD